MVSKFFSICLTGILLTACADKGKGKQAALESTTNGHPMTGRSRLLYQSVAFDSQKDLVCGMPVKAGVSDTAHYKGKVYGFCAKECKDEFLKNPKKYLAAK